MPGKAYSILVFFLIIPLFSCAAVLGPLDEEGSYTGAYEGFYETLIEGPPDPALLSVAGGFFVWKLGDIWQIRVVEKRDPDPIDNMPHTMTGQIYVTNGMIVDGQNVNLNPFNNVSFFMDRVNFQFEFNKMGRSEEGFDFRVHQTQISYCVALDVKVDGVSRPGLVRLGNSMQPPESLPVTFCFP